ncbi:MurR/RpiR family transcriptional regulator [Pediococcus cellicola]|uniref:Transcription regulator n=1 Tax=Pediococcus cellicola TaxID=319652 RepID=A0A0R2IS05_9LACO|nr:MurR/RpiR family transcriptional regulator [Pediococcus cellicola]KRN65541.1 transcription regulator [Pediococcus cellicola]GEL15581.1 transcriptional regulator [Pediococcus cellicola]
MKFEEYVNNQFDVLNDTEKSIVDFILDNKMDVARMSISELANKCLVSRSSVFRFAKKIGLDGFNQLKFILREEMNETPVEPETNYMEATIQAVTNATQQFQSLKMNEIYASLDEAEDIYIYSTGWEQEIISEQLQRNFFLAGKKVFALPAAVDELEMALQRMKSNDLLMVISYSGNNKQLLKSLKLAVIRNITTLSFTPFKQNSLAEMCKFNLYYSVVEKKVSNLKNVEIFFTGLYVLNDLLVMGYSDWLKNK